MTAAPSVQPVRAVAPWSCPGAVAVLALRVAMVLGCLGLSACGDEATTDGKDVPAVAAAPGEGQTPGPGAANALRLSPWHGDFPFEIHMSPRVPGQWYGRTRRQAFAKIVANLQGACTAEAWQFAKFFFDRAPAGGAELLATAADENFLAAGLTSYLENLAEAMARAGDAALAPTLLRLLDHENLAVRSKAMSGLISCGTSETVLAAEKYLDKVSGRAHADWFRAVARHVPDVVRIYRKQLALDNPGALTVTTMIEEAIKLPPALGVPIAEIVCSERRVPADMLLVAASVLHAGGDRRGSALLREFLRGENPSLQAAAVRAAAKADAEVLLDDVLRLVDDDAGEVRLAVAEVLAPMPGANIDEILTTMGADVSAPVRQLALRALVARGKRYHLDQLVERVRTATGNNLTQAMQDVSACGDPAGLEAVYERMQKAPLDEHRMYLQALAYSRRIEVFPYLREVFLAEDRVLGASGLTAVGNSAMLMANLEGALDKVVALFGEVPRTDYVRRSHLLRTVGNLSGVGAAPATVQQVAEFFAKIRADRTELPQIRLLALQFARRHVTLDDAMAMRAALAEEPEPMRWALNDFLFEFF